MQVSSGYKFFAIVCFCLLVGSALFPFATQLLFIYSRPPVPLSFDAVKETFWSFMSLHEWLSQREDGYATVDKSWSIFSDYWSSTTQSVDLSRVLVLAFILQVVCLFLGIFVVVSEIRMWKSILLLSLLVILDILYLWVAQVFYVKLYVGFWLSVLSTVFGLVPVILAYVNRSIKKGYLRLRYSFAPSLSVTYWKPDSISFASSSIVVRKHIRIFILLSRRRILVNAIMKEMIYVVLVLLIVFSPLIGITVSGHLFDRIDSPSYLNGLITAAGVFVAFICATTISRAREIDSMDFLFVRVSLFMFIAAMFWLGYDSLRGFTNVILGNVGLLSTSLYLCGFTTWSIMHALSRKSHS